MARLLQSSRYVAKWTSILSREAAWLHKSDVFAVAVGACLIVGVTLCTLRLDYRANEDLWKSRLTAAVRYRTWALRNSLQVSQDDLRVLADFTPTSQSLLLATPEAARSLPDAAAIKQVMGLFENYGKVYEYAAICLLDGKGHMVAQATDSAAWQAVIGSQEFQDVFRDVVRGRHYVADIVPSFGQELALVFAMPVGASGSAGHEIGTPLGVVAMLSPLARELLPLLKADSSSTRTEQAILLQFQGVKARYLSPRGLASSDRTGRVTHSDTLLPAASSAVEDHPIFGHFIDDQGIDVLASLLKIPTLNGVVAVKVDHTVAFADVHRTARLKTMAAAAAVLAYACLILLYRRSAVAREMRKTEESLRVAKQTLEINVAERTTELAQSNQQLHRELGERKRVEEEIRALNSELDQRVRDRSAQLEMSNKELEAFAYTVSHDLRAPLRAIDGFSKILIDEYAPQLSEEPRRYLGIVRQNTKQMGDLIDGLLSFSRLHRQALSKETIAPADLVRQAWENLAVERGGRQIELTIADLPRCQADPLLLKQVFVNFLSNALKYSRTRKIAKIEVGCTDAEVYYIRDNGVGFDMRYCDKLFSVFQRLHTAAEYEGTGVGLAIVQRIIGRHGGRVWADAVLNKGATFYFTLGKPAGSTGSDAQRLPVGDTSEQMGLVGVYDGRSLT